MAYLSGVINLSSQYSELIRIGVVESSPLLC